MRPTARDMLNHPFITNVEPSKEDFLPCVQTDDHNYLQTLVSRYNVNELDFDIGKHLLEVALSLKRMLCFKILVEDAQIDISKGRMLLVTSVGQGTNDISEYLLKMTAIDVNEADAFGNTALILACKQNNRKVINLLCSQPKIDADCANIDGRRALHEAAIKCNVQVFKQILRDTNAKLGCTDNKGRTVLMAASAAGNLGIVKFLTNTHANSFVSMKEQSLIPSLFEACSNGRLNVVDYLINEAGADPTVTNSNVLTILREASFLPKSATIFAIKTAFGL